MTISMLIDFMKARSARGFYFRTFFRIDYFKSSQTLPARSNPGVRSCCPIFRLAGQACHGLLRIYSSACTFLRSSIDDLPSGSVTTSMDFTIPSGEMINVPLLAFPVSVFRTPKYLLIAHVLSLIIGISNHVRRDSVSIHLL